MADPNPLIANATLLKRLAVPDISTAQMPQQVAAVAPPPPIAPPPALPLAPALSVLKTPNPQVQNTNNRLLANQTELKRLQDTGSGISQIKNPVLRTLARIGETGESILAPGAAALTPGTGLHNQYLQGIEQGNINNDLQNEQSIANTALLDAQPQLKQQALENATLKTQGTIQHQQDMLDATQERNHQTYLSNLRNHGFTVDETDPTGAKTRPLRYDEMSSTQQAVEDLNHARAEQAEAQAALKRAQNDPSAPAFRLAQERVNVAERNAQTAIGKLANSTQSLDLRRQNTNAALYGTDNAGNALPGSAQIMGDDGNMTTVGAKFAPHAISQQKAVGSFNDLSGSVGHTRNALTQFFNEGGSLSDPRIVQAMSDPHSTVGKVINGKLVTNGLSPAAVTAINSVRQLHEQAGILRSTTGGTSSEAGAQRILDVVPSAGDNNAMALSKLDQQDEVLKRLAPGMTGVSGGVKVKHQGNSGGSPSEGATKVNSHGDKVVYHSGKWGPA